AVPDDLFAQTLLEVREQFGAVSAENQVIRGLWQDEGQVYRDELSKLFVDVPDTPENREFFAQFKETLKARFQQLDIWMTTYPIQVIGVLRVWDCMTPPPPAPAVASIWVSPPQSRGRRGKVLRSSCWTRYGWPAPAGPLQ